MVPPVYFALCMFLVPSLLNMYNNSMDKEISHTITTSTTSFTHLAHVYELLIATYGEPTNEPDGDPLGGLDFGHLTDKSRYILGIAVS